MNFKLIREFMATIWKCKKCKTINLFWDKKCTSCGAKKS
jgi:hypothetical protein